jgi:hypothetical protein
VFIGDDGHGVLHGNGLTIWNSEHPGQLGAILPPLLRSASYDEAVEGPDRPIEHV